MALTGAGLVKALRDAGLDVHPERGHTTAKRPGAFTPEGVAVHHTATVGTALGVLRDGRPASKGVPALRPPVVQLLVERSGRVHVISAGRSNHAGRVSGAQLSRVRAGLPPAAKPGPDSEDGNRWLVGIEVDNDGRTEPWSPAAYRAAAVCAAVVLRLIGRPDADRVIGHKELTKRKPDPLIDMDRFREAVAAVLVRQGAPVPVPGAKPPAPATPAARLVRPWPGSVAKARAGAHLRAVQDRLNRGGHGRDSRGRLRPLAVDGVWGPRSEAAVRRFQRHAGLAVDGVVGPVTWLRMFPETRR